MYKLRKDGFIKLKSDGEGIVATRENVWHGGELHVNIKAKSATVAVYRSDMADSRGWNLLGHSYVVDGYSHEDCVPFSGDVTDWVPQFKNGRKIDDLKDGVLAFEIKFSDGEIYSLSGDYIPVFNVEAERWRQERRLPEYLNM